MPSVPSSRLSHWLLVSRLCPLTSSLPIAMISAFIPPPYHRLVGWARPTRRITRRLRRHCCRLPSGARPGGLCPTYQSQLIRGLEVESHDIIGNRVQVLRPCSPQDSR